MSKLLLPLLTIAAFLYAVWLLVSKRRLPDPERAKGIRRRFYLAVVVFAGLLAGTLWTRSGAGKRPMAMCYTPKRPPAWEMAEDRDGLAAALKAAWRETRDEQDPEFRTAVEGAVGKGLIRKRVGRILSVVHTNLAFLRKVTEIEKRVSCYDYGSPAHIHVASARAAQQQLGLLRKLRLEGKINEETAAKVHMALARELQAMDGVTRAALGERGGWTAKLIEDYNSGKTGAGDAAAVAADLIMEMEGVALPDLTPEQRVAAMKKRVTELLLRGPQGNDWRDPAIQPNVQAILKEAGLLENPAMVMCYDRGAAPVKERSDELERLQQELLDKNVRAGVLDVEVAEKAALATARESEPDYATEADIRSYQQSVRRAGRMLYKMGELPSSYVRELEWAADTEIIGFVGRKALPSDVRYHLRSVLWDPMSEAVLKALEGRKLVPAARNHRLVMQFFGAAPKVSEDQQARLEEFIALIDGEEDFALPGDEEQSLSWRALRPIQREYPMKIRRVCRALIKTRLCDRNRLKPIEQAIGLPIVSRLEN